MINNFHVLVVHFPIALLTLYALIEIGSVFKELRNKRSLEITKAILVVSGTVGAIISRMTGESVNHAIRNQSIDKTGLLSPELWRPVLELHEGASLWATGIFIVISIGYIIYFFETTETYKEKSWYKAFKQGMHSKLRKFLHNFSTKGMKIFLAVLGLLFLTLTGAFGGILVHGCQSDVLTQVLCSTMLGQ